MMVLAISVLVFVSRPGQWRNRKARQQPSTNDADGVRVVPRKPLPGAVWKFSGTMDTRTNQLNDDLTKTAALVDDGGRRYLPLSSGKATRPAVTIRKAFSNLPHQRIHQIV